MLLLIWTRSFQPRWSLQLNSSGTIQERINTNYTPSRLGSIAKTNITQLCNLITRTRNCFSDFIPISRTHLNPPSRHGPWYDTSRCCTDLFPWSLLSINSNVIDHGRMSYHTYSTLQSPVSTAWGYTWPEMLGQCTDKIPIDSHIRAM